MAETSHQLSHDSPRMTSNEKTLCRKLLDGISAPRHAALNRWFLQPVNPKFAPDYNKIIAQPMDLSTISHKLRNDQYRTAREFEEDFNLMFSNCFTYNMPATEVFAAGKELCRIFQKKWAVVQKRFVSEAGEAERVEMDDDKLHEICRASVKNLQNQVKIARVLRDTHPELIAGGGTVDIPLRVVDAETQRAIYRCLFMRPSKERESADSEPVDIETTNSTPPKQLGNWSAANKTAALTNSIVQQPIKEEIARNGHRDPVDEIYESDPKRILELYKRGKYRKKPFAYPDEEQDTNAPLDLEYQRCIMAKYELEIGRFYRDPQYENTLKSQYLRPNRVWRAPPIRMKTEDIQQRLAGL